MYAFNILLRVREYADTVYRAYINAPCCKDNVPVCYIYWTSGHKLERLSGGGHELLLLSSLSTLLNTYNI